MELQVYRNLYGVNGEFCVYNNLCLSSLITQGCINTKQSCAVLDCPSKKANKNVHE